MKRKLLFVYNGDSGLVNSVLHLMHKTFSPSTYECRLCALVYNGISLDKGWRAYMAQLDVDVSYCHRDTLRADHGLSFDAYPLVLEQSASGHRVLMSARDFDAVKDLDDLQSRLSELLSNQGDAPLMGIERSSSLQLKDARKKWGDSPLPH